MSVLSAKTTKLQERQMNKKVVFDTSAFGKRVSAEIPEPTAIQQDPDVIIAMDEKQKINKLQPRKQDLHSVSNRIVKGRTLEEVNALLDGKIDTDSMKYYINNNLVKKLVAKHPYITSVRHLATLCGFINSWEMQSSTKYQALLGSKRGLMPMTKEDIQKVAEALKFKNWKVLIHPDVSPYMVEHNKKAKAYFDEVARLEAEFDEE